MTNVATRAVGSPQKGRSSQAAVAVFGHWMRLVALLVGLVYLIGVAIGWIMVGGAAHDGVLRTHAHPWAYGEEGIAIAEVAPDTPADRAGLRPGDLILGVDGIAANPSTYEALHDWFHRQRAGDPSELRVRRASAGSDIPEDLPLPLVSRLAIGSIAFEYSLYSAVSLMTVLAGVAVVLLRPRELAARLLLVFAAGFSLVPVSDLWHWAMPTAQLADFMSNVSAISAALASAALLHLFLAFPTRQRLLDRLQAVAPGWLRPVGGTVWLLYVVPPLVLAALAPGTPSTRQGLWSSEGAFVISAGVLINGLLLGALVALIWSYVRAATPLARAQLKWILWGLAVGVTAIIAMMIMAAFGPPATGGRAQSLTPLFVAVAWLLFPIGIGIAVIRHRLFDIDLIINRTIVYGALTLILGASLLVASTLSQRVLEAATGQRSDLVMAGVALALATVFQPLRRHTKALVDRFLPPRQVLALLFTDIVGSTERAVQLGDQRWREVLETFRAAARRELKRFTGHEVDAAGDGIFATFDSPARALRCGQAMATRAGDLGLETRVGLHCGECEMRGEKISGLNVHIAARVMALAGPGEVLASEALREWLTDTEVEFAERGSHTLPGVPGQWRLYALVGP